MIMLSWITKIKLELMAYEAMFPTPMPLFGDLWQHKQSKHKFAKIDKIRATYTCLEAYHHPNSP
jgi:hypothetical protein